MVFYGQKGYGNFMDCYSETAVKYKLTVKDYLKIAEILILGTVVALLSLMFGGSFFAILIAGDIYAMYFFISRFDCEYEYLVTNGELDADKITAKSRRKRLANIKAGEFLLIAKRNEKHQHQINSCARKINAPKEGTHFAIYQKASQKNCIFFTPDQKMLDNLRTNVQKGVFVADD